MANVLHKNLTGSDLHEPKGAASANDLEVYVANGSGSGAWSILVPVGIISDYAGSTEPTGWLFCDGDTIGNATSGGTARANADTVTLFTLLWNSFANTELPIQDSSGVASTRGASAAADYAANKRMPLPDLRGRVTAGWDNKNNVSRLEALVTDGTLGDVGGAETVTLAEANLPAHTHSFSATTSSNGSHTHGPGTLAGTTTTNGQHSHTYNRSNDNNAQASSGTQRNVGGTTDDTGDDGAHSHTITVSSGVTASDGAHTHTVSGTSGSTGSGTATNVVQPTFICTKIIYYGV